MEFRDLLWIYISGIYINYSFTYDLVCLNIHYFSSRVIVGFLSYITKFQFRRKKLVCVLAGLHFLFCYICSGVSISYWLCVLNINDVWHCSYERRTTSDERRVTSTWATETGSWFAVLAQAAGNEQRATSDERWATGNEHLSHGNGVLICPTRLETLWGTLAAPAV